MDGVFVGRPRQIATIEAADAYRSPSPDCPWVRPKAPYPNVAPPDPLAAPHAGGGRVGALLLGPDVQKGYVDDTTLNHFSLLRLVQDSFDLPPLGYSEQATKVPVAVFSSSKPSGRR